MASLEIEKANFYQYLRLGSFYRQFTPYKNVTELRAGTFLIVDCNCLSIKEENWWNINHFYRKQNKDSLEESLQKTEEFLRIGIKRRLETSDLEVGSFLSGGIDSCLVTSIASEYKIKLKTFTV